MINRLFIVALVCLTISCAKKNKTALAKNYFDLVRPEFKGEQAYKMTAFVEKYWRIAGNTGFNATVFKIAEDLEQAGYVLEENATASDRLTYRIEKRPMKRPTWEPVNANLTIVGESQALLDFSTNRNMIYQYASSTPEEGVQGEIIYIGEAKNISNFKIKGKIVFLEGRVSRDFIAEIQKQGALGFLSYNNPKYLQPEKNVTSIQFRSMRYREDSKGWAVALSYEAKEKLKAALVLGKVKVNVSIETKIYPSEELTIVADVKRSELPKERLVFSAHIQEPGANDNATGVGAQLEMAALTAKFISENSIEARRTLTFLWGDEIISTRRYIEEDSIRARDIKWGISLDMVGENTAVTGGSFLIEKMPDPSAIWTRGNDQHTEWGGRKLELKDMKPHYFNDFIIKNFKEQGKFANWEVNNNPYEGGSDHIPFLRADIPGLLLWHFTDQFYHTDNDRIDKVSQETLKNVGIGALVSAFILINADVDTGIQLLNTITTAAEIRLNTEFLLSKTEIASGNDKEEEILILNSWKDWYLKALDSVNDVETEQNEELNKAIQLNQQNLTALYQSLINQL